MAVPRPLLLGLVGAVLVVAMFVATQAMKSGEDEPSQPAAPPEKAAEPATPAAKEPAKGQAPGAKKDDVARASTTPADRQSGLPADVAAALGRRKPVVLFFQQRGADDAAVRDSVRALDRRGGAAVFSDSVRRIDDYELILGDLEVTQGPAIVIVDRERKARVIEGYVDEGTLAQEVRDAKR
ncbi:MAG: hypothetical protein H0V29_00090 [Thermoleophilaceae bacterium]|nr:hypothetical protein [Thermoleophilaceae bacterium]